MFISDTQPILTCDRCHNVDEVVVAIMQIPSIGEWALCGTCRLELPTGLSVV
jgi:hypothetical protein